MKKGKSLEDYGWIINVLALIVAILSLWYNSQSANSAKESANFAEKANIIQIETLKFEELNKDIETIQRLYAKYKYNSKLVLESSDLEELQKVFEGLTGHIDIDEKNDSVNYAKVKESGIKLKEACERYIQFLKFTNKEMSNNQKTKDKVKLLNTGSLPELEKLLSEFKKEKRDYLKNK